MCKQTRTKDHHQSDLQPSQMIFDDPSHQRLISLTIINIIVLILVVLLSNFTYAEDNLKLHQKILYEITKYTPSKQNAYIIVGEQPLGIGVNNVTNTIYVANQGDNSVSVIDGKNNTKIIKDIHVGKEPLAIGVDEIANCSLTEVKYIQIIFGLVVAACTL